jgi:dihydrofolate reductase
MRRVVIDEFVSIDGIAQAPGGAHEDRDEGFEHGGWHMPYMDDIAGKWVDSSLAETGGLLLGRRTYEIFAAHWPHAPAEEQAAAVPLNAMPKYVVSKHLREPLAWHNSKLLKGDLHEAVTALRQEDGKDLHVIGSTRLVRSLLKLGLVDELRLMIDPLLLGGGKSLFPDDRGLRAMQLVESRVTSTGAILARYAVARG